MKRLICIVLTAIMTFSLLGCVNTNSKIEYFDRDLQEQSEYLDILTEQKNQILDELDELYARIDSLIFIIDNLYQDSENSKQDLENSKQELESAMAELEQLEEERAQKQKDIERYFSVLSEEKIDAEGYLLCGYRFLKMEYEPDNISFRLYCGYDKTRNFELEDFNDLKITLYVDRDETMFCEPDYGDLEENSLTSDANELEIVTISNFFRDEKYQVSGDSVTGVEDLSFGINIKVPQELLVYELGVFEIVLTAFDEEGKADGLGEIRIYYRIVEDCVILSKESLWNWKPSKA